MLLAAQECTLPLLYSNCSRTLHSNSTRIFFGQTNCSVKGCTIEGTAADNIDRLDVKGKRILHLAGEAGVPKRPEQFKANWPKGYDVRFCSVYCLVIIFNKNKSQPVERIQKT
jgi:hypothetical protein